jgi:hypothetical protein
MEEDDELDGPSLLLRAMEERERQYKEEESEKGNAKDMTFYFACCCDGRVRESSTTSNSTKTRARRESRKINAVCISRMYVTCQSSGAVGVKYISSHTNHDLSLAQVKFLPLPKDTKDSIAIKLSLGIPIDRIMDDIREDLGKRHTRHMFANEAQQRHFVTRRDVLNMSRKVNHLSRIRHENDAQSVEEIVAELKQESYNPILCYKRQGILDPDIPQLPADGFVVAFQTKFQKDLYEMFASTIVCIDSTHKTNSHNFKLITVVVPDEYGGQPVAWCIADREDIPLMSLFLGKLHERSPTAEVKTIMTDDTMLVGMLLSMCLALTSNISFADGTLTKIGDSI